MALSSSPITLSVTLLEVVAPALPLFVGYLQGSVVGLLSAFSTSLCLVEFRSHNVHCHLCVSKNVTVMEAMFSVIVVHKMDIFICCISDLKERCDCIR